MTSEELKQRAEWIRRTRTRMEEHGWEIKADHPSLWTFIDPQGEQSHGDPLDTLLYNLDPEDIPGFMVRVHVEVVRAYLRSALEVVA
jgi:hypothetical protein